MTKRLPLVGEAVVRESFLKVTLIISVIELICQKHWIMMDAIFTLAVTDSRIEHRFALSRYTIRLATCNCNCLSVIYDGGI